METPVKQGPDFYLTLLTLGVILLLLLPELVKDGMFADGVLYAAVARNEAHGLGSCWFPRFSETIFIPFFHQQPPLTFWILSLFYRVLGDSMYTERIYSLCCALISGGLISAVWKTVHNGNSILRKQSWLPVLFWIITPVCFYSFRNNLEENSLSVFTLLALLLIIHSLKKKPVLFLFSGACAIVLAMLCKGLPGLYPLAFPFLYWLVLRTIPFTTMLIRSLQLLVFILILLFLLWLWPDARMSLGAYLHDRLLNSILHVDTGQGRLHLLVQLLADLGIPFLAGLLLYSLGSGKAFLSLLPKKMEQKNALLFFLLGLCASLPLMVTREQRWFYTVPAIPAFGLAFSFLTAEGIHHGTKRITSQRSIQLLRFITGGFLVFVIGFAAVQVGKIRQDEETDIHDTYLLGKAIPVGSTVNSFPYTYNNWALQQYLNRYFGLSVTSTSEPLLYFITDRTQHQHPGMEYEKLELGTRQYDVYKHR
ncbi:MAG TPA: glycosyltransferase family 39 protein [Bacteroidia bacterium]|jgi:4-amino-4-deoxy-L-arabinose transferase-like glycosyltransferase|nr:glycosyltransferase family 39 protein [Bacteroidia bacterium]